MHMNKQITIRRRFIFYIVPALLLPCMMQAQGSKPSAVLPIDVERSALTVHVFKSGLFSAAGDNHEVRAPIASGSIREHPNSVELTSDARKLRALDPNLSAEKRMQVQQRMLGSDVLDSSRFPQIRFHSVKIEQQENHWLVRGELTLHGENHPVMVEVSQPSGKPAQSGARHYTGHATLKQSDFGIKPISIAGGSVKVKDEVKIDFDIWTK